MLLQLSTWIEVESYLRTRTGILLPIGATEQHGPSGLLGTDSICAEVVARGAGDMAEAMVAPTLGIGMSEHHMRFPGSMTLAPTTLIAVVRDCVVSLAEHGFRRFLFVNGHGGNVATLRAAFAEIHNEQRRSLGSGAPDLRLACVNWWEAEGVARLAREMFGAGEGLHATPSEVSVALAAYPNQVRPAVLEPVTATVGPINDSRDFRRRFPDGRIGSDPSLASEECGRRLTELAVVGVANHYRRFVSEP